VAEECFTLSLDAVVGVLGWSVGLGALALLAGRRFAPGWLLVIAGVVTALIAAPYLRGALSDLSMTSLVLSVTAIGSGLSRSEWPSRRELRATFRLTLLGGVLLYPMALGLGPFDPYALGYRSPWLLLVVAVLAGLVWWIGQRLPLICLAAGVAAFAAGLLPSQNLWDYLLDPFVVIAAALGLRGLQQTTVE
jgi:hypothetical protein